MKSARKFDRVKTPILIIPVCVLVVAFSNRAMAADNSSTEQSAPPPAAAPGSQAKKAQWTFHTASATEIVKMQEAGVEKSIIQKYVESSSAPYRATSDDIIYLHQNKVPDELITQWIQRGTELRSSAAQIYQQPAPQPEVSSNATIEQPMVQPAPVIVQSQPQVVTAPSPTVVYTSPNYVYSDYPASWYWGWSGPPIYLGFSWRGGYYNHYGFGGPRFYGHVGPGVHGGYYGGFHGGTVHAGFNGGGFHGGGFSGGFHGGGFGGGGFHGGGGGFHGGGGGHHR
jgi:hypothetical protein